MKRLIIKIPKEKGKKWSLQQKGTNARRYIRASSLFSYLQRVFPRNKFQEKTVLVVNSYIDSQWTNINETCSSNNPKYLLYCLACFLEDYLTKGFARQAYKKYVNHSNRVLLD